MISGNMTLIRMEEQLLWPLQFSLDLHFTSMLAILALIIGYTEIDR